MCFGGQPLPYGEPIGPPDQKQYAELWMVNQAMQDRQMRRTRTAIARPALPSPLVEDDDDDIKNKLGG